MMRELADNIMDIAQNSISAGANLTEVTVKVSHHDNLITLIFRDDGCGIPKDKEATLFSGYGESGDLPADSRRAGMGIGLSVCASIIKAHGGEIWGGNRRSGGAEICFALELEEESHE